MACELAKLVRHLYDSFSNGVFFDTRGKTTAVRRNSTASLTDLGQDSEECLQPVCVDLCALRPCLRPQHAYTGFQHKCTNG